MYNMNRCMYNYMHMNPYQSMNNYTPEGMFMCPMMNMYYMNQNQMLCNKFRTTEIMNIKEEDSNIPKIKIRTVKLEELMD